MIGSRRSSRRPTTFAPSSPKHSRKPRSTGWRSESPADRKKWAPWRPQDKPLAPDASRMSYPKLKLIVLSLGSGGRSSRPSSPTHFVTSWRGSRSPRRWEVARLRRGSPKGSPLRFSREGQRSRDWALYRAVGAPPDVADVGARSRARNRWLASELLRSPRAPTSSRSCCDPKSTASSERRSSGSAKVTRSRARCRRRTVLVARPSSTSGAPSSADAPR